MHYHKNYQEGEEYESISSESESDSSRSSEGSSKSSNNSDYAREERHHKRSKNSHNHFSHTRKQYYCEESYTGKQPMNMDSDRHRKHKRRKHKSRRHREVSPEEGSDDREYEEVKSSRDRSRSRHGHKSRRHRSEGRHKKRSRHREREGSYDEYQDASSGRHHSKKHKRDRDRKSSRSRRRRKEERYLNRMTQSQEEIRIKQEVISDSSDNDHDSNRESGHDQQSSDSHRSKRRRPDVKDSDSMSSSSDQSRPASPLTGANIGSRARVKQEVKSEPEEESEAPRRERDEGSYSRNVKREQNEDSNSREQWGKPDPTKKSAPQPGEKKKPDMGLSGKLTEDANMFNGVVIKYSQPPEARKPKRRWRWYIFKGDEELPFLPLHRQSAYLIGRDRKVCDIPTDHPSCSKQHAVMQYRLVPFVKRDGTQAKTVKPFLIDLESANGTFINNRPIEKKRYYELMEKDVVKFGFSSREYILLHEGSKDDEITEADLGVGNDLSPISLLCSK